VWDCYRNMASECAFPREEMSHLRQKISSKFQDSQECHPAPKSPQGVLWEKEQTPKQSQGRC